MGQEMLRLRKRSEFLAAQKGEKRRGALFLLEVKERTKPNCTGHIAKNQTKDKIKAEIRQQISFAIAEDEGFASKEAARADLPRIGYTVTRKNGNAVCRNRIKRRLRAAVRLGGINALAARKTDYVIIARRDVLTVPFVDLVEALRCRFQNIPSVKKQSKGAGTKSSNKIAQLK